MADKIPAVIYIGGNFLQEENISSLKDLGVKIFITDRNASAPMFAIADGFKVASGDDHASILEYALVLSEIYNIIGIYGGADFAVATSSIVGNKLKINGPEIGSVLLSLDKEKSKTIWRKNNIPTPNFIIFSDINEIESHSDIELFSYPLIVKPSGSCGSQGVVTVTNSAQLLQAASDAFCYSSKVLVEEFFDGVGIDVNGIIWDGVFIPQGIAQREFAAGAYHFPIKGFAPPHCLSKDQESEAYALVADACMLLGINNSPVKGDLLFRNDKFALLEVTPRFHGDIVTGKILPNLNGHFAVRSFFSLRLKGFCSDYSKTTIQENKFSYWRGVFPKTINFEFDSIDEWIKNYCRNNDSAFFEGIYCDNEKFEILKPKYCESFFHRDNSTVVGFVLMSFDGCSAMNRFDEEFGNTFSEVLI